MVLPEQSFRFAHISDLHFSKTTKNISQFFSKRWVGNLNLILRRRKSFHHDILDSLIALLQKEQIQTLLISGDLTSTSLESEFEKASVFVKKTESLGIKVILLPGNHDSYTKEAYQKKLFYHYFSYQYHSLENLKEHEVAAHNLFKKWWLVLLDTTLATPLLCSHGKFSETAEKNLQKVLSSLPKDSHVILANHFPLMGKHPASLHRSPVLQKILQTHPNIRFYLHGHDHKHKIVDLKNLKLPICIDAGSASYKKSASWTSMELFENRCKVQPFKWKNRWLAEPSFSFTWD